MKNLARDHCFVPNGKLTNHTRRHTKLLKIFYTTKFIQFLNEYVNLCLFLDLIGNYTLIAVPISHRILIICSNATRFQFLL